MQQQPDSDATMSLLKALIAKLNVPVFLFVLALIVALALFGGAVPAEYRALVYIVVVGGLVIYLLTLVLAVWRDRRSAPEPAEGSAPEPQVPAQIDTDGGVSVGNDVNTGGGGFTGRDTTTKADRGAIAVNGDAQAITMINAEKVVIATDLYWRDQPKAIAKPDLRAATQEYLRCILDRHSFLSLKGMGVSDRIPLRLPLVDLYVPLQAYQEMPAHDTWDRPPSVAGRQVTDGLDEQTASMLGKPRPLLELVQEHDGLIILGDPGAGKTTFLKFLALQMALGQGESLGLGNRLPILLPLSAYANVLADGEVRLDEFVADYCYTLGADLPIAALVADALQGGRALVLLDGLDEVHDPRLRNTVVDRVIDFFTYQRQAGNKFVLSSRIVGYREVRPVAEGLGECTVADFESKDIQDFVARWTATLERQAQGDSAVSADQARREAEGLLSAVEGSPGVRRLASNPLLLTILALMKRQGVSLPERRVELYEQYVRVLLSLWNRARGLGRAMSPDLDPVDTVRVLAPLALWMHEINPGVGLVKREALRRKLEDIFAQRSHAQPALAAQRFLQDLHDHAGLLLERGPGEYGFIHLTFEEYLAAVAVAQQGQLMLAPVVEILRNHAGDPAWHEVSLLTIAYLSFVQQRDKAAGAVVVSLASPVGDSRPVMVVLAGEAAADTWPGGVPAVSRDKVGAALILTMQDAATPGALRRRAGLALGSLSWLPDDLDEFVHVQAGDFLYGDKRNTSTIAYDYWIAKYPVTNAQFARFVADGGYERPEFWSDEGWSWRQEKHANGPRLRSVEFENPIFPAVDVTAFEADAYAAWLGAQGRALCHGPGLTQDIIACCEVRLPKEEEWERAARGQDGREYPWDGGFDAACCNTSEGQVRGISAVCTYPQGVSPTGVWDMSGNVWEWTASSVRRETRVLRGGSWSYDQGFARCAYRDYGRILPVSRGNGIGFRVVVSPGAHSCSPDP